MNSTTRTDHASFLDEMITLNWAIFEIAADTRKISLRYSALCGAESDVVDAVIS